MLPRPDLRDINRFRPFSCNVGAISDCDGSCKFSQGNTTVVATISFAQSKSRYEIFDRASLIVSCSLGVNRVVEERDIIEAVEKSVLPAIRVLEYPRRVIVCNLHVLSEDGSLLSCAINASSMAVMNSGIQLSVAPLAVTVFTVKDSKLVAIDPDEAEERVKANSILTVTFSNVNIDVGPKSIFSKFQSKSIEGSSPDQIILMTDFAAHSANALYAFLKTFPDSGC